MTDNQERELRKVLEAVSLAASYHVKINEANSKLHCSETVLHSPMTNKLILAQQSLERILDVKSN
jgi:hypothetical protein